jgi:hypothetical protein
MLRDDDIKYGITFTATPSSTGRLVYEYESLNPLRLSGNYRYHLI